MRVGVVGDVHGRAEELLELLRQFRRLGVDRIILLGDLIDRGPRSDACLEIARLHTFRDRSGRRCHLECVLGNHEDGYLRILADTPKPGKTTVAQPEELRVFDALTDNQIAWMAGLPLYIRVPELNLTCMHGGVAPWQPTWGEVDEWSLRMRFLDKDGNPVNFKSPSTVLWAAVYDGRFGGIAFGHESAPRITYFRHAVALDGHTYGRLYGAVFSNEPGDTQLREFVVPYRSQPAATHSTAVSYASLY